MSRTCVDVFEAAQHLVQEELVVLRRQVVVRFDDLWGAARTLRSRPPQSQERPQNVTGCNYSEDGKRVRLAWCRSVSMSSKTTKMSLNSRGLGGSMMCLISTMSARDTQPRRRTAVPPLLCS